MHFDEDAFFRQATLSITSSLDVEIWLCQALRLLRQHTPAEQAFLTYYRQHEGLQCALASADVSRGRVLEAAVPAHPSAGRTVAPERTTEGFAARASQVPAARPWIRSRAIAADDSILWIRLVLAGQVQGALTLTAEGPGRFEAEHLRRLVLLREPFAIALAKALEFRELVRVKELLAEDNRFLHQELRHARAGEIVGAEFGLRPVMDLVRKVARRSSPVLLLGETGTGKELIAQAVHDLSPRHDGPFVKINCGAIPPNLIDSELFGHERGAFTGAHSRRRGRFERADGGTLFLDEVGELDPAVQVRLLRSLQEHEIERVGGQAPVSVDVRIIAATHRDLEAMTREGSFRQDLYFRLAVFPITVPSLRERSGDIPSLVHHFIQRSSPQLGLDEPPTLAAGTMERLMRYAWPGNVRELENAVERELILRRGAPLDFDWLASHETTVSRGPGADETTIRSPTPAPSSVHRTLDEVARAHIEMVLDHCSGKVSGPGGAAERLGVNPSTLRKRMRKLGVAFGRGVKRPRPGSKAD